MHLFLYSLHLFVLFCNIYSLKPKSTSAAQSLCDNPVIHSADRMVNGTVRLYRDNQFWELNGLPNRVGLVRGPTPVWYKNFGPIHENTSVMTCLVCNRKDFIFKHEGTKWWAWQTSGRQWKGGEKGELFKYLPKTGRQNGFDVVFHNGKTDEPFMIGIIGHKVFYYSTKNYYITPADKFDAEGYEGGKFGENFPKGVRAGFSWPPVKPEDGYNVFFFKDDKYCFRKEKAEKGKECEEWRESRELFGCNNTKESKQKTEELKPKEVSVKTFEIRQDAGPSDTGASVGSDRSNQTIDPNLVLNQTTPQITITGQEEGGQISTLKVINTEPEVTTLFNVDITSPSVTLTEFTSSANTPSEGAMKSGNPCFTFNASMIGLILLILFSI